MCKRDYFFSDLLFCINATIFSYIQRLDGLRLVWFRTASIEMRVYV